eukprot:scaffold58951_cov50-Attheya_sp.AAC.3
MPPRSSSKLLWARASGLTSSGNQGWSTTRLGCRLQDLVDVGSTGSADDASAGSQEGAGRVASVSSRGRLMVEITTSWPLSASSVSASVLAALTAILSLLPLREALVTV